MADKEIRILIVDDQRDVARLLRASLELLDRGYSVVDVPSAEEAFLEPGPFDLLVTDYRLPGITGLELVERMRGRDSALQSIIVTGVATLDAEKSSAELKSLGVLRVFEKPIETDEFTSLVIDTLGGDEPEASPKEAAAKTGDAPSLGSESVEDLLSAIHADLDAQAVALVARNGRIVAQNGKTPKALRFEKLVSLLVANFTATGAISAHLGGESPAAIQYYRGGKHDIYALAVGQDHFLTLVYPADSAGKAEDVVKLTVRVASDLLPVVGESPESESPAKVEEPEPEDEPGEDAVGTAPESIDLDALEAALEGSQPADAEGFWEKAAEDDTLSSATGRAISLDEAIDLGLIPKDIGDDE